MINDGKHIQARITSEFRPFSAKEIHSLRSIVFGSALVLQGGGLLNQVQSRQELIATSLMYPAGVTLEAHVLRIYYRKPVIAFYSRCLGSNCAFTAKVRMLERLLSSLPEEQEQVFAQSCIRVGDAFMKSKLIALVTGVPEDVVVKQIDSTRELLRRHGIDSDMFIQHFMSDCTAQSPEEIETRPGQPFLWADRNNFVLRPAEAVLVCDGVLRTFSGITIESIGNRSKLNRAQFEFLKARYDTESGIPHDLATTAKILGKSQRYAADISERISGKLRRMGLSLWHYVAANLSAHPELSFWKVANGRSSAVMRLALPFADRMFSILQGLSSAQLFVVQCRGQLDWEGYPQISAVIADVLAQQTGYGQSTRTPEKHLEPFMALLKKERINIWTLLVAATDGNPELIMRGNQFAAEDTPASG